jgi:adenine-specific DNA methylase
VTLEERFDPAFAASLALKEKQIQQSYRPVIGVHKWFARRPGTLFRSLLLAEFDSADGLERSFFRGHRFEGVIGDPFMGGGTPLIEANRLGFHIVGTDINPMAYWIVRQELGELNDAALAQAAEAVAADVARELGHLYETTCVKCCQAAQVKYFLWVKTQACPECRASNDLFPGYLLAEATRHPKHVIACSGCGALVELEYQPRADGPALCSHCSGQVLVDGPARRNRIACRACRRSFRYPPPDPPGPPQHRMWAMEYYCAHCKPGHPGRFFKNPDADDLARWEAAQRQYGTGDDLPIPQDGIPEGDETRRLHRWGYRYYSEMLNGRQLLGLGTLLRRIVEVAEPPVRHALLTVFSDILRYQNMLCRYDTYALKCQDIFSVHGFPVGLVPCENNLLGIPGIGSGSFRHFVEKYRRAKAYCEQPFETYHYARSKRRVAIAGETIGADLVEGFPEGPARQARLSCGPAADLALPPGSLDGVFTDPPYFDNVQYAELMDFCYVWLRQGLKGEFAEFEPLTTRTLEELTGNATLGRGLEQFTDGLSRVFVRFAEALKPAAPFVFTYHHNDVTAYAPLVVALLDAELFCTAVLPAPAEMEASLHINNTDSSILDTVFVSRRARPIAAPLPAVEELQTSIAGDCRSVAGGGVRLSLGDVRCLFSGHVARLGVHSLYQSWDSTAPISEKLKRVREVLLRLRGCYSPGDLAADVLEAATGPAAGMISPEVDRHASASSSAASSASPHGFPLRKAPA